MVDDVGVATAESVGRGDALTLGQRVGGDVDEGFDVGVAGPSMVDRNWRRYSASRAGPRSGLENAMTG